MLQETDMSRTLVGFAAAQYCEISEELKVLVYHLQILRFQVSFNLVLFATISASFSLLNGLYSYTAVFPVSKQPDPNGEQSKFFLHVNSLHQLEEPLQQNNFQIHLER